MNTARSRSLFEQARSVIPGGVDSPVRAFRAVATYPLFIERGAGSRIWDADGNEFVDYVQSWGPLILGHANPRVVFAVQAAAERGTSFGAPTELETRLAQLVVAAFPSIERVRFVNSGTEATMSALRLARGFTRRDKIVKFEGCYHGHADGLLVKAGSGALTFGAPDSPGVTAGAAAATLTARYNDLSSVERLFDENVGSIAAIIVEPIAGNMGVVLPAPGFLEGLREITQANGALLVFDEVITGFRVARGGVQELTGIRADLTCLGKIIGGGLPVGAYGGRADIMAMLAPDGPVYQAGTLSGNPLAMSAGIATVEVLADPGIYVILEQRSARLAEGLADTARSTGVSIFSTRIGSMFTTFFTDTPVVDYQSAKLANTQRFSVFFNSMLEQGIYLAPSQFEAGFLSLAHTDQDVAQTIAAARVCLRGVPDDVVNIGHVRLDVVNDCFWRVDGGAMFGVVPRPMWERTLSPDARNRVSMAARCLLIRDGTTTILVDTGLGNKLTEKQLETFGVQRDVGLVGRLATIGVAPEDVDIVVDTHLHFDHAGGNTSLKDGVVVPTFPRAEYWIQRREWLDATHPNERTRSTYLSENLRPIELTGQIRFVDGPADISPSVRWVLAPGHTPGHTCVVVESGQVSVIFTVDVCPFRSHLERLAWVPGVDLEPLVSMETKRALIAEILDRDRMVIFDHDPRVVVARLTGTVERWNVEVVEHESTQLDDPVLIPGAAT